MSMVSGEAWGTRGSRVKSKTLQEQREALLQIWGVDIKMAINDQRGKGGRIGISYTETYNRKTIRRGVSVSAESPHVH